MGGMGTPRMNICLNWQMGARKSTMGVMSTPRIQIGLKWHMGAYTSTRGVMSTPEINFCAKRRIVTNWKLVGGRNTRWNKIQTKCAVMGVMGTLWMGTKSGGHMSATNSIGGVWGPLKIRICTRWQCGTRNSSRGHGVSLGTNRGPKLGIGRGSSCMGGMGTPKRKVYPIRDMGATNSTLGVRGILKIDINPIRDLGARNSTWGAGGALKIKMCLVWQFRT